MNLRTTLILLLIFLALGSYYVFVERNRPTEQEIERREKSVLRFEREAAQALEIQYGGEDIRCIKSDEGWEMVRPVADKCDETAVAAVLASLASLKADRFLDAEGAELENFGLDDPSIRISVASYSPPDSNWLFIGAETPTGDTYYSMANGRDSIALVPSSTVNSSYKKSAFDLRDKKVLDFEVGPTRGLEILYDDVKFTCERIPDRPWQIREPFRAQGDDTEINSVLWDLENAKVREFIDEPSEDLSEYGLDDPAATVKVFVGAGRSLMRLDFGDEAEEGGVVYAKRRGRSEVVKVDKRILDKVKTDPSDLRQKRLLDFATSDVTAIDISMVDTTFSCVRDSTGEWHTAPPNSRPLKKWKMNGVSSQISFLRAFSFIDEPEADLSGTGLLEPQVKIVVTLSDTGAAVIDLGAVEGDELFVKTDKQVAKVSGGFLDDMRDVVRNPPYEEEETTDEQP